MPVVVPLTFMPHANTLQVSMAHWTFLFFVVTMSPDAGGIVRTKNVYMEAAWPAGKPRKVVSCKIMEQDTSTWTLQEWHPRTGFIMQSKDRFHHAIQGQVSSCNPRTGFIMQSKDCFHHAIQGQVSSCNPRTGFIMHLAFLWVGYLAWSSCVLLLEFSNWKTQILFCATWDVWIRRIPTSGNIPEGFFWLAPDEFSSSLIILS